jgi:2,3-bisphosphoglycerate-independent phosphoglycerate mutase
MQRKFNSPDSKPKTSYITNKVPFILANAPKGWSLAKITKGVLGDVAPTILEAIGLKQPEEITGCSLLVKSKKHIKGYDHVALHEPM